MTITIKRKYKYPIYFLISLAILVPVIYTIRQINTRPTQEIKNVSTEAEKVEPIKQIENIEKYKITKDFKLTPVNPDANKKVVLLTIDDGPSAQSLDIVKILEVEGVKAIFFINGMKHKAHPEAIKEEYNAGHMIGNHTWSHQNLKKITEEKAKKEIDSNSDLIKKETGSDSLFFRAPYGILSPFAKKHTEEKGMLPFNWSDSALDWEKSSHDKKVFINNITKSLRPGSIILMHEHTWSRDALPDLITEIKAKGYTFVDPKNIIK
ncbi:MAG: polysaccharide deacetylase family protein [Candidatus Paceibacterota bacterium]